MGEKSSLNANQCTPPGLALLRDPAINHGAAFTAAERDKFNLRGFLPPHVELQE